MDAGWKMDVRGERREVDIEVIGDGCDVHVGYSSCSRRV